MIKKRAIIAMSGGVDSSVAAALTQEKGYDCMGVTMELNRGEPSGKPEDCSCSSDARDAELVAEKLGMAFQALDYSAAFDDAVIRRFVDGYMRGDTPNPCIDCNRYIKFEKLMEQMYALGYDYLVTGHYARIIYDEKRGRYLLKKGMDEEKDQSYVLYQLTQEQLAHTLFPLGEYTKQEIRELARKQGFANAAKKDSQDICFVPDGSYAEFIEAYTGKQFPEGAFVTEDGTVLGTHRGIIRYTIGQRKGLGLSLPAPLYVCGKDMEENKVILGPNDRLFKDTLIAGDVNWISIPELTAPLRCKAKIRYRQKEAEATVSALPDGKIKVVFDLPVRGITTGQSVVLYDGDTVIGGGKIEASA